MDDEKYIEENYDTFSLNVSDYKTKLTRKYLNRKKWAPHDPSLIKVFIPGTITSVVVKKGQKVKAGEPLVSFEAMKMDNIIVAPFNAVVKEVNVKVGDLVTKETVLIRLE